MNSGHTSNKPTHYLLDYGDFCMGIVKDNTDRHIFGLDGYTFAVSSIKDKHGKMNLGIWKEC